MSYQREREDFLTAIAREGMYTEHGRKFLSAATTLNRLNELACSSEAADRDRIPCPAVKGGPCLCDTFGKDGHENIPRIRLQDHQTEERVKKLVPEHWTVEFQGDPRGCPIKLMTPTGREIAVPPGPSGIRW